MKKERSNTFRNGILLSMAVMLMIFEKAELSYAQDGVAWKSKAGNNVNGFVENKGQVRNQFNNACPDVLYVFSGKNFNLTLTRNGFSYELFQYEKQPVVSESNGCNNLNAGEYLPDQQATKVTTQRFDALFIDPGKNMLIVAEDASSDYLNYYHGNISEAVTQVHYFNRIYYRNIYPKIDLVFIAPADNKVSPRYEYIVHAGGNVKNIRTQYNTAEGIQIKNGSIVLPGSFGEVREENLFAYQVDKNLPVNASFQVKENLVSFNIEKYDHEAALVIDPDIVWATYYGENDAEDKPQELSVDAEGNLLVIGNTASQINFTTSGAYQSVYGGADYDAFILKLNAEGQRMWCTYFGGSSTEDATDIYTDASSDIFAAGATYSTNCPVYNAFQPVFGGVKDGFLFSLDSNGLIRWATYYGGSQPDVIAAINGDEGGNIYFTGWTQSTNKIATSTSYQPQKSQVMDAFLAKFDSSGIRIWSTYYGGKDADRGHSVTVDKDNNVIMTGTSPSTTGIATIGSFQPVCGGMEDVFCVKFNANGSRLWGTYFGGSSDDKGREVVTGEDGSIYFTGFTTSQNNIATLNAWQPAWTPGYYNNIPLPDVFFARLNAEGTALIYSTYLGGVAEDYGINLRVKPDSSVLLFGSTYSTGLGTPGVWQSENAGEQDAFIAKFLDQGQLDWFTYYGGPDYDRGNGMEITADDFIYISGNTASLSGIATVGSYKDSLSFVPVEGDSLVLDTVHDCMIAKFADRCFDKYEPNNSKSQAAHLIIPAETGSITISALISYKKDNDYFSFENNALSPNISIVLTNLPANYNLYLLNASGAEIANSKHKGLLNEQINFNTNTVGTFLVKVKSSAANVYNNAMCYSLTCLLIDTPFRDQLFNETNLTKGDSWMLYPCPASGEVNIDFSNLEFNKIYLNIYDLVGHLVYNDMIDAEKADSDGYHFDVGNWENGCYLVRLLSNNGVSNHILSVIH
ncbi:MAG: T9SS type A sorting domain-containing protein [Chitinophagaceae bacterium]|nr:T9SS type A sorting domain-containing protein [Chitinophagaceae bacterium]